tara:strand:- start:902 stop:1393 length:492 start_codon:yes stop_codon:yes gene_type:complete
MATKDTLKVLTSSERVDWCTPVEILDLVYKMGPIGLDPCGNTQSLVDAERTIELPEDGLQTPWIGHGLVYVNPPYGRAISGWLQKCATEAALGAEIVLLMPSRTDTRWFHKWAVKADVLCFWKGRITFDGAPSPAPFPSVLAYWGPNIDLFDEVFDSFGQIVY